MRSSILSSVLLLSAFCSHAQMSAQDYPDIKSVGAMMNVKWKGQLQSTILLDTISEKEGLYGLGPQSYLKGELLINNGKMYLSKVASDTSMIVTQPSSVGAPFFVYGNVVEWQTLNLNEEVSDIPSLEGYIDSHTKSFKRPFAFKLTGRIDQAQIHIQNLPEGMKVASPKDAHTGAEEVEIIGFFSTKHQGVFTHHDSYLHMHLITKDGKKMGHLDSLIFDNDNMVLYLPLK